MCERMLLMVFSLFRLHMTHAACCLSVVGVVTSYQSTRTRRGGVESRKAFLSFFQQVSVSHTFQQQRFIMSSRTWLL